MIRFIVALALAAMVAGCVTTGQPKHELVTKAPKAIVKLQERPVLDVTPAPAPVVPVPEARTPTPKWIFGEGFLGFNGKHVRWYVDRKHHRAGIKVHR